MDVSDGCWRRNALVTVLAILVDNIHISWPTLNHQHHCQRRKLIISSMKSALHELLWLIFEIFDEILSLGCKNDWLVVLLVCERVQTKIFVPRDLMLYMIKSRLTELNRIEIEFNRGWPNQDYHWLWLRVFSIKRTHFHILGWGKILLIWSSISRNKFQMKLFGFRSF